MITGSIFRGQHVLVVLFGKILTQPTGLIIEVVLTEKRFSWEGLKRASEPGASKSGLTIDIVIF